MKRLNTYISIVLRILVAQELSPQTLGDMGYSEYGSPPTTDWKMANSSRTTAEPLFGPMTTHKSAADDYNEPEGEDEVSKVILCQGENMMLSMPAFDQCGMFSVYEDEKQEEYEKKCLMASKPNLFWIHPFTPGEEHTIVVYDRSGTKLLKTRTSCLKSEPPDITYNYIQSGAGWILVKVKVADESSHNLVGVEVLYKRIDDQFWWRSYVDTVSYKHDIPRVIPVHYCPDFVEDGTFCLLLTDGVYIRDEKEKKVEYQFKMSAFRIGPLWRTFGSATDETYVYRYCDWLQMNCNPPMGTSDEYEVYEDEVEADFFGEPNITSERPLGDETQKVEDKGEGTTGEVGTTTTVTTLPPFLISTTWGPEMWIQNVTKPPPKILVHGSDLWVVYLALLIILISILLPLAFWLGTRAGYHEAEGYWTELSSTGGNVNISLGYVGTEWTRPVAESNPTAA